MNPSSTEISAEPLQIPKIGDARSLAELVYCSLQDAITQGTLAPGFRLREIQLSRHFGVSTTPIREALRRLEREGLVEVGPRRGAVVAAFGTRQIMNLYEIREVLERRAVRRAAEAVTRDLSQVDEILSKAESVLGVPDQVAYNRLDAAFHRALNDLGENAELAELAERVHRQIQAVRVRCAVYLPGRPTISHAEHQAIVAAVRARDPDRAETLVRAHIFSVRDAVIHVYQTTTPQRTRE